MELLKYNSKNDVLLQVFASVMDSLVLVLYIGRCRALYLIFVQWHDDGNPKSAQISLSLPYPLRFQAQMSYTGKSAVQSC